jgi:hypothetical protein
MSALDCPFIDQLEHQSTLTRFFLISLGTLLAFMPSSARSCSAFHILDFSDVHKDVWQLTLQSLEARHIHGKDQKRFHSAADKGQLPLSIPHDLLQRLESLNQMGQERLSQLTSLERTALTTLVKKMRDILIHKVSFESFEHSLDNKELCTERIRRAITLSKYLEDYLIEKEIKSYYPHGYDFFATTLASEPIKSQDRPLPVGKAPKLGDESNNVALNVAPHIDIPYSSLGQYTKKRSYQRIRPRELKNGDIILASRSSSINHLISQLSVSGGHYNYTAMIHKAQDGQLYAIESTLLRGLQIVPLEQALKRGHTYIKILRPKISKTHISANKAGNYIFDLGHTQKRSYDVEGDLADRFKLSMEEVPVSAYFDTQYIDLAGHKSRMVIKDPQFLKKIGRTHQRQLFPDDLLFNEEFETIVDWRNPRLMREHRFQSAIISSLYEWMSTSEYQFRDKFSFAFLSIFHQQDLLDHEVPLDLKKPLLRLIAKILKVTEIMHDYLMEVDPEGKLTFQEIKNKLEEFRQADLERYFRGRKKGTIHRYFIMDRGPTTILKRDKTNE